MRFDLVVNNLAGWAHAIGSVKVMSDGTLWRPVVHIEDIGLAALAAACAPREAVHNQAFNIGRADANYRIREIAEAIQHAFPSARLEITGELPSDPRSYRVEFKKALDTLPGFDPQWTLEMGVDEIADFLRRGGLGGAAFDSRQFVRLKQLKYAVNNGRLDSQLRVTGGA
jgi:nucleoside-diphosphate-sugar epimerase